MRFRTRVRRAMLSRFAGGVVVIGAISGLSDIDRSTARTTPSASLTPAVAAEAQGGRALRACLLAGQTHPVRRRRDALASGLFAPVRHAVYFVQSHDGRDCAGTHRLGA